LGAGDADAEMRDDEPTWDLQQSPTGAGSAMASRSDIPSVARIVTTIMVAKRIAKKLTASASATLATPYWTVKAKSSR
jgi:hypothetical protein